MGYKFEMILKLYKNRMIKHFQVNSFASDKLSYSSLKQSLHNRANPQFSSAHLQKMVNTLQNQYPQKIIIVNQSQFQKQKQIYEWRQETEFPIVKIRSWRILSEKQQKQEKFCQILVQLQSSFKLLEEINKLPFFQAIYVLKESMIGFERLCHRFGFFDVSANMIMFNQSDNCKVWINEDCFSTDVLSTNITCEKEFIYELCNIVAEKTVKSRIANEFFNKIQGCKYFFEAICAIDSYAKVNKIKIPSKLQNLDEVKSPLLKTSLNMNIMTKENDLKNLTKSNKIPQFIQKNQVKKKYSNDIYTPAARKMTIQTEGCILDRSTLTNVSRNLSTNSFLKNDRGNIKQNKDEEKIDQDTFLKDLNIRLIQPTYEQQNRSLIPSRQYVNEEYDHNPESPFSPFGMVSEIDFNSDKKSGFSFIKCASKQEISPFETAQKMFLTVMKPVKESDAYSSVSQVRKFSPRYFKTHKNVSIDQDRFEDFDYLKVEIKPENNRSKRKYSGDFGGSSARDQPQNVKQEDFEPLTPQYKTQNLLQVQRPKRFPQLSKSPSHQVFKNPFNQSNDSQSQEGDQRSFLRETIMNKNGWTGLELLNENKEVKESFVDDEDIPQAQQSKTSELPKLGKMGKDVKSSMINSCQFQLEFGDQLEKQKSVRDEVLSILD